MKPAAKPPRSEGRGVPRQVAAACAAEARLASAVREIFTTIGADGGGLAVLNGDAVIGVVQVNRGDVPFPWQREPRLLDVVREATEVVRHDGEDGRWLFAPVWVPQLWQPWMLWARRDARDVALTDAQAADFAAAAARLGYRLPACCPEEIDAARRTAFMDQAAWMSGRLAHDFGNVLTGILGFTELTLAQLATDSPPHRYLTEVWQAARAGAGWVHQLQMFGRRSAMGQATASVAQAVELASQAVANQAAWPEHARLQTALPKRLPLVALEGDALRHALVQLLNNAREACASGGSATLAARSVTLDDAESLRWLGLPRPGAAVEIAVADTGAGMTAAVKSKVFRELFFSSKPRHRGVGLAVAYGIVRAHRGGLRLEDNAPRGTVVRMMLPAAVSAAPSPTAAAPPGPTATAGPPRFLEQKT